MSEIKSVKISQEFVIEAPAEKVFQSLTQDVDAWWDHSFEKGSEVLLEPQVGGKFHEVFKNGDGALYATVTYVKIGKTLKLSGPMGMSGAIQGFIEFNLEAKEGSTIVKLFHHVIGEITEEMQANYGTGWKKLLGTNLKNFVESGIQAK